MPTKTQNEQIAEAMKGQAAARKTSRKERVTGSKPAPKPEPIRTRKPRQAVVATKPRVTTVLADPVDNARLIRMRAKWSAQREEVRAARAEEKHGEQSPEAVAAREIVAKAWQAERAAYAEYSLLLKGRKAQDASESGDPIVAAAIANAPEEGAAS